MGNQKPESLFTLSPHISFRSEKQTKTRMIYYRIIFQKRLVEERLPIKTLVHAVETFNKRPRKRLNYLTPYKVFFSKSQVLHLQHKPTFFNHKYNALHIC